MILLSVILVKTREYLNNKQFPTASQYYFASINEDVPLVYLYLTDSTPVRRA